VPDLLSASLVATRRSPSGSGVIFAARTAPGSHHPRVASACVRGYSSPSTPLAVRQSTGGLGGEPPSNRPGGGAVRPAAALPAIPARGGEL